MAQDDKPVLGVKPTSQLDLERRRKVDHDPKKLAQSYADESAADGREYATEDTDDSNYVGVSPEYMTHANDTEKPLRGDEGVEAEIEDELFASAPPVNKTEAVVESNQIAGTGSTDPLLYPSTSGQVYSQDEFKAEGADKVPTTVEKLSDAPKATRESSPTPAKSTPKPPTPKSE